MNEAAREALRAAALKGTPQIYGQLWDMRGGACAQGVMYDAGLEHAAWQMERVDGCHLCGAKTQTYHQAYPIWTQGDLLVHLNNDHKLDFIGIAEKMPQEAV